MYRILSTSPTEIKVVTNKKLAALMAGLVSLAMSVGVYFAYTDPNGPPIGFTLFFAVMTALGWVGFFTYLTTKDEVLEWSINESEFSVASQYGEYNKSSLKWGPVITIPLSKIKKLVVADVLKYSDADGEVTDKSSLLVIADISEIEITGLSEKLFKFSGESKKAFHFPLGLPSGKKKEVANLMQGLLKSTEVVHVPEFKF
jgi:hypothetical protein